MKVVLALTALLCAAPAFAADKKADKAAAGNEKVQAMLDQLDATFAKHDATAMAAFFADDATLVMPAGDGTLISGKENLVKAHEGMFKSPMFQGVTTKHTVQNVRWIGKDDAFIDASVVFNGMQPPPGMPAGAPAPTGHVVVHAVQKGGKWLFADVRPYMIMPMPPAGAPAPAMK